MLLISPTTLASTSKPFTAFGENTTGITCSLLGSSETLTLQIWDEGISGAVTPSNSEDSGWTNVIVSGLTYQCTNQFNIIAIALDVLTYRVVKTVTASAIGVAITQNVKILAGD